MLARTGVLICALAGVAAAGCATQTPTTVPAGAEVYPAGGGSQTYVATAPVTGSVVRVDEPARVLVFDDGRMWQVAGDSTVLVDGTPVVIGRIAPGTRVVVPSGQLVQHRDGRYEVIGAAASAQTRRTVWGTVTDVDADGEITVRAADGDEVELRVPRSVAAGVRKGDTVRMDVEFIPAGAASPRMR